MPGYGERAGDGAFTRSREFFESVVAELAGGQAGACTHSELRNGWASRAGNCCGGCCRIILICVPARRNA
jgi:hypothetical protein